MRHLDTFIHQCIRIFDSQKTCHDDPLINRDDQQQLKLLPKFSLIISIKMIESFHFSVNQERILWFSGI